MALRLATGTITVPPNPVQPERHFSVASSPDRQLDPAGGPGSDPAGTLTISQSSLPAAARRLC